MWEIREPIYNKIVKRIKETGKSYWSGIIDGQGWSFHGSIIINNEEIIPIWWEFNLDSKQVNDFSFEKLKKIFNELNIN